MRSGQDVEDSVLEECEQLFKDAEEYFEKMEGENREKLKKQTYKNVGSRINTNLQALKHSKMGLE